MSGEMLVLRLIHVVGGVIWVGTLFFVAFFLMPSAREAGPGAAAVMAGLQRRKLFVFIPVTGILVMLAGIRLMMLTSNGFSGAYFATPSGQTYAWAGGVAILAFVYGFVVARPATERLTKLMASPPNEGDKVEIAALQQRIGMSTKIVAGLLILATVGMALARYL